MAAQVIVSYCARSFDFASQNCSFVKCGWQQNEVILKNNLIRLSVYMKHNYKNIYIKIRCNSVATSNYLDVKFHTIVEVTI